MLNRQIELLVKFGPRLAIFGCFSLVFSVFVFQVLNYLFSHKNGKFMILTAFVKILL
jgi:hypothetical protein